MKICPICNAEYEDSVNFCKKDGSELVEKEQIQKSKTKVEKSLSTSAECNFDSVIEFVQFEKNKFISKNPISILQYCFLKTDKSSDLFFEIMEVFGDYPNSDDKYSLKVIEITLSDAKAFCEMLNKKQNDFLYRLATPDELDKIEGNFYGTWCDYGVTDGGFDIVMPYGEHRIKVKSKKERAVRSFFIVKEVL